MVLSFDVAGDPAEFEFNQATGSAEVRSSGKTVPLQNPLNPKSHSACGRPTPGAARSTGMASR